MALPHSLHEGLDVTCKELIDFLDAYVTDEL